MPPSGQRDYSTIHLSRHALERFQERFNVEADDAERGLRTVLERTRRLGRNAENHAIAVLGISQGRPLVAILQDHSCLTVLTWDQFLPRLPDFGRARVPRKWGRLLRRLASQSAKLDP